MRQLSYGLAIREALSLAMEQDKNVVAFGLGIDDPKGIFGTTLGLQQQFGKDRVFDMPTSENGMTGVAIGAALNGIRPVMLHQRLDFFLLAMDQLVNNAAKWFYMFGGKRPVPLVIRLILGRGWGQGPTHSQSLHSWFAHIPGLKVVMPASPSDAKGLLLTAIFDDNPVLFLEHRWLHEMQGDVPEGNYRVPIGKANILKYGNHITLVSTSYMTVEALHAVEYLATFGISAELIDLRTVSPIDWPTILNSVEKTGKLLALDISHSTCSVASEVVARVSMDCFSCLKRPPQRMCLPDFPSPTSPALTQNYYPRGEDIAVTVARMLDRDISVEPLKSKRTVPHDVPGSWFRGPF